MLNLLKNFKDYKILAEDKETLQFNEIESVTEEVEKHWQLYEIDHDNKTIYLEAVKHDSYILITTGDILELPLTTVKNINEAAQYMQVEATHVYRAWRNAERPKVLMYKDFKLYFL